MYTFAVVISIFLLHGVHGPLSYATHNMKICVGTMLLTKELALCFALVIPGHAVAQSQFPNVSPQKQAQRDGLRQQVLDTELRTEIERLKTATQARAKQLAARDAQGVADAEKSIELAHRNIAALQREIALTNGKVRTAAPTRRSARVAVSAKPDTPVWWDGYARHAAAASPEPDRGAWWNGYTGTQAHGENSSAQ